MTVHSVTLDLPSTLYARVEQRAAQTQRSVEEELLDVLTSALPASEDLPADLAAALAPLALLDDTAPNLFLAGVFLARVGMAAIHHHDRRQARAFQFDFSLPNALGFIVRAQAADAKDDMTGRIAGRSNDAGDAFLIDPQKTVRCAGGLHGVQSDLQAAIGAVLEPNGHREAAGHLAMGL